jgi:hypothetical protein
VVVALGTVEPVARTPLGGKTQAQDLPEERDLGERSMEEVLAAAVSRAVRARPHRFSPFPNIGREP